MTLEHGAKRKATRLRWIDESTRRLGHHLATNFLEGVAHDDYDSLHWRHDDALPWPRPSILKRDTGSRHREWLPNAACPPSRTLSRTDRQLHNRQIPRRPRDSLEKSETGDAAQRPRLTKQKHNYNFSTDPTAPQLAWELHGGGELIRESRVPKPSSARDVPASQSSDYLYYGAASLRMPRPSSADSAHGRRRQASRGSTPSRGVSDANDIQDLSRQMQDYDIWPSPDFVVCSSKMQKKTPSQKKNQSCQSHANRSRRGLQHDGRPSSSSESRRWAQPGRAYDASTIYSAGTSTRRPRSSDGSTRQARSRARGSRFSPALYP